MTSPRPDRSPAEAPARPPAGGDFVGPWYAWWPGDPLPPLPALPGFAAAPADDDRALAALACLDADTVTTLRRAGNRPYIAYLDGQPVAHGWSAERMMAIGELALAVALPPDTRYLWGFVTKEQWRGRGLYPRLLQAILRQEGEPGAQCWLGHTPDNMASATGILRAGFRRVGDVFRQSDGRLTLVPVGPIDRARAGAALLGADLTGADDTPPPAG